MRLLVTRPQPAAEATARRLGAEGHRPLLLPLAQAEHLPEIAQAALETPHAAIALTSAEAVRVLAELEADLTPHKVKPCFCVGEATSRAARALGFTLVHTAEGTGKSLAELIAATPSRSERPLLYLAGSPRSKGFEATLRQLHIDHVTIECYRMQPITHPPDALTRLLSADPPDAVLLYSHDTARRFAALLVDAGLEAAAFSPRYLCLSAAVAAALPEGAPVEIAARPDEESLFSLL
ncbi:uroporphyrinogen III synthase [Sinorhizobium sp. A49]|jgi:uroporphyrinogen-III synthase|uniref:uroporphyrinogen-III synthase n=1 Tax=Sinorhizobium sp. A49 TaxID=1945861 RepID=UPI00098718C9|nr:uroporphyrinogen-III synthase [Sinorhizobium sp. A49]OOG71979.1 uroporphyrinogen III synthase [Sinorhizobium sp. A49]